MLAHTCRWYFVSRLVESNTKHYLFMFFFMYIFLKHVLAWKQHKPAYVSLCVDVVNVVVKPFPLTPKAYVVSYGDSLTAPFISYLITMT